MKVKVSYTVDVDDNFRRAIRAYHGQSGMATRAEVREWFKNHGHTMDDDLEYEYSQEQEK